MGDSRGRVLAVLRRYCGYDSFRPGQADLVDAILSGRDVLGVMPTGAGKSVCYQVPAVILPGLTIVVSPLVSLMRDQVDALNDSGIAAAFVNGTQDAAAQSLVLDRASAGSLRMLYVAPERLETPRFREFASCHDISMVAVDEAHCISQWGQDFRSAYLGIADFLSCLSRRPVVAAFTATATERVRRDIIGLLRLDDPMVTVTGFDRPNLFFDVIPASAKAKKEWMARYIGNHPGESGIVYCSTRRQTEDVAAMLIHRGIGAVAYHAGMDAGERERAQRRFITDEVDVAVATNAFGMGIDKSNVRYVIHHNLPESLEAYYQEAGRAGRDGEPGRCTLLWNESDIVTRRRLLESSEDNDRLSPESRERVAASRRRLLDSMVGYCRTTQCLHRYIRRYFDDGDPHVEGADRKCGMCVNCTSTRMTTDVTGIAVAISRCVHDLGQRYGMGRIADVLRGSKARDVIDRGWDSLPSYGALSEVSSAKIREVGYQMASEGLLAISSGRLPVVGFGPQAVRTVDPAFHLEMSRLERRHAAGSAAASSGGGASSGDVDEGLVKRLRALRRSLAAEASLPPYMVFSDRTLRDMAHIRPVTDSQFLAVSGVGETKLARYGPRFMRLIRDYGTGHRTEVGGGDR